MWEGEARLEFRLGLPLSYSSVSTMHTLVAVVEQVNGSSSQSWDLAFHLLALLMQHATRAMGLGAWDRSNGPRSRSPSLNSGLASPSLAPLPPTCTPRPMVEEWGKTGEARPEQHTFGDLTGPNPAAIARPRLSSLNFLELSKGHCISCMRYGNTLYTLQCWCVKLVGYKELKGT